MSDPSVAIDKPNMWISNIRLWMIKQTEIKDSRESFFLYNLIIKEHFLDVNFNVGNSKIVSLFCAPNLAVIFDNHMGLDN